MEPVIVYYEDTKVGDESPPFVIEGITRAQIARYAGASGDYRPIHLDDAVAQKANNPSVFAHGMFIAGLLGHLLSDWLGAEHLRRYKVRFAERVWPGDTITCSAMITRKYEEDGVGLVDVECRVTNQAGKASVIGEATAALPRRG